MKNFYGIMTVEDFMKKRASSVTTTQLKCSGFSTTSKIRNLILETPNDLTPDENGVFLITIERLGDSNDWNDFDKTRDLIKSRQQADEQAATGAGRKFR